MDSNTGLVRYDEPNKNAIPVPKRFNDAAKWCADNGVALHSDRNPDVESREWAKRNLGRGDPRDALPAPPTVERNFGGVRGWGWPSSAEAKHARTELRKAQVKRRRKLQKQRGLR